MRRLKPFTHAIFDLDGTLLDSEPMYTEATQAVVDEFGVTYDPATKQKLIGRGLMDAANILVKTLRVPITAEQYVERRTPILERLLPNVAALPGVQDTVAGLHRLGIPLAIATSSHRRLYELKVQNHPWLSVFEKVVCGDDPRLEHSKPAPDIFLLAASDLNAEAKNCVVFEDAPSGVEAGRAAGMQVVAIRGPFTDPDAVAGADLVIERYEELELG